MIKVGFVSPDFKRHSIFFFIYPVLKYLNAEVYCYFTGERADDYTKRCENIVDHWRFVHKDAVEIERMIRADKVDILFDLAGWTPNNSLFIFNTRLAPVQVTWLNHVTSGMPEMDYKIVDFYTDPPGMTEKHYSEKLIRMPFLGYCFTPNEGSPDIKKNESSWVRYGAWNNPAKFNILTYDMWGEILRKVPYSNITLKYNNKVHHKQISRELRSRGVDKDRIILKPFISSYGGHLSGYNDIDIFLDTYPYNGVTTTLDCLWMGVPVITLVGTQHMARQGYAIYKNLGDGNWDGIAETSSEYINKAIELAFMAGSRYEFGSNIRRRITASPIMNCGGFCRLLEERLLMIYRGAGNSPA